ncbi:MAG: DNA-3-methyladenine glycosylase [Solirubrobacteraceae bacterium]
MAGRESAGSERSGAAIDAAAVGSRPRGRLPEVLPVEFYARPVLEVARELIGCVVDHEGLAGMIVETEAYHESEPACHAFVGVTPRTSTLFGEPGMAYVYRSYGIHALLNAVCEPAGVGAAVLIRALEPLAGIEEMRARRGRVREEELCSGPGKLTQALGVELAQNGTSLIDGPVVIRAGEWNLSPSQVVEGPRIGISKAVDLQWRFCAVGSAHVSKPPPPSTAIPQ